MEIKVGDYRVRTDSLQLIVEGRTIIQEEGYRDWETDRKSVV